MAGLEPYDSVGLLRSVVVPARHRGQGYGTALVEAVSAHASDTGIERLYLYECVIRYQNVGIH